MVNIRSEAGQDIPFVINQLNQVPSSTTRISDGSRDAAVLYGTDAVESSFSAFCLWAWFVRDSLPT
jgi:hypothetical protein